MTDPSNPEDPEQGMTDPSNPEDPEQGMTDPSNPDGGASGALAGAGSAGFVPVVTAVETTGLAAQGCCCCSNQTTRTTAGAPGGSATRLQRLRHRADGRRGPIAHRGQPLAAGQGAAPECASGRTRASSSESRCRRPQAPKASGSALLVLRSTVPTAKTPIRKSRHGLDPESGLVSRPLIDQPRGHCEWTPSRKQTLRSTSRASSASRRRPPSGLCIASPPTGASISAPTLIESRKWSTVSMPWPRSISPTAN